jgi:dCTP deaminase
MAILPDWRIRALCTGAAPMVAPFDPELLNPASLDVRLGETIMIESAEGPALVPYPLSDHDQGDPYWFWPGQFILAHTVEVFNLPDGISAQFVLKSSRAREGLNHLLAGWCDPGWHGSSLTLELQNVRQLQAVPIWPGMRVGQMVFHSMSDPPERSYREVGRYNGDRSVQGSRG